MRRQVLVMMLLVLAFTCQMPAFSQTTAVPTGGTVVMALNTDPEHLNPSFSVGPVTAVGCKVNEGLVSISSDFAKAYPQLAKSWTISKDGLTYTFRLQDGVRWHDGKPFTSADVKFTYEQLSPLHPRAPRWLQWVQGIEASDNQTVIIRMKKPYAPLLASLSCAEAGISPKHLYEGTDFRANPFNRKPIGTGPFKFEQWQAGDRIVLVRNEQYWKKGLPYLDRIILKVIPDSSSMMLALRTGDIDYVSNLFVSKVEAARLRGTPGIVLKEGAAAPDFYFVFLNLRREPFKKVETRKALLMAIDRGLMLKNVFVGFGEAAKGLIPQQLAVARSPSTDLVKMYPYDVSAANQLLEKAGLMKGADGTRFKLELVYEPGRLGYDQQAEILVDNWQKIGVSAKLAPAERQVYLDKVFQKRDFDAAVFAYSTVGDPAIGVARLFLCEEKPTNFGNPTGYCKEQVDKLFIDAQQTTGFQERNKIYRRLQEILAQDLPVLEYATTTSVDVYTTRFVFDDPRGPGPALTDSLWDRWEFVHKAR